VVSSLGWPLSTVIAGAAVVSNFVAGDWSPEKSTAVSWGQTIMEKTFTILGFAGSLRKGSYNKALLESLVDWAKRLSRP
jgi:hypothetical protein